MENGVAVEYIAVAKSFHKLSYSVNCKYIFLNLFGMKKIVFKIIYTKY